MKQGKHIKKVTIDELAGMVKTGFEDIARVFDDKLDTKLGTLRDELRTEINIGVDRTIRESKHYTDTKVGELRTEMHDGFDMIKTELVVSGRRMQRILDNHEDRISDLEAER